MIFLDANSGAAISPLCRQLLAQADEMQWHNPSAAHSLGQLSKNRLETSRETIGNCLGVDPEEIIFTSGGSESVRTALGVYASDLARICIGEIDHPIAQSSAQIISEIDSLRTESISVKKSGIYNFSSLVSQLNQGEIGKSLISLQIVHSELGAILNLSELQNLREQSPDGTLIHLDGCQALGKLDIQPYLELCDIASFSAHKFGALAGTGFLWIRNGIDASKPQSLIPGTQEWQRRGGTENALGIWLMSQVLRERVGLIGQQATKWLKVMKEWETSIQQIANDVCFLGPALGGPDRNPQTCFFRLPGLNAQRAIAILDRADICISAGTACRSGLVTPNETMLTLGYNEVESAEAIRISLDWNTSITNVQQCAVALGQISRSRS